MGDYLRPDRVEAALAALGTKSWSVLAGGTDFYPARVGPLRDEDILDISGLSDLRGIAEADDHWRMGALTTWTDVIEAPLPPCFDGLKLAAREVGGVQIQNAGTLAGNLCNASPAADGVPPLLALDAEVELSAAGGTVRRLALPDFVLGNRKTARRPDELVTGIVVPKPGAEARSTFLKLGARKYLVISIVMVAAVIELADDGKVADARIAVGACSAAAVRLKALEQEIVGHRLDPAIVTADLVAPAISPIDDMRGTADYRREAAATLVRRALETFAGES